MVSSSPRPRSRAKAKTRGAGGGFRKNHGQAGVVYILENPGLAAGWFKIGCSRHSGAKRAQDLNSDANTGTPGLFKCIFEVATLDCGRAEQAAFEDLALARKGKWGQEYFMVDLDVAKVAIRRACKAADEHWNRTFVPPPPPPAPIQPPPAPAPRPTPAPVPATAPAVATRASGAYSSPVATPTRTKVVMPDPAAQKHRTDRYCPYCRRIVHPKPRLLFRLRCPTCDASL